jgi:hypothetical protein
MASPIMNYKGSFASLQGMDNLNVHGVCLVCSMEERSWAEPVFVIPGSDVADPKLCLQPMLAGMMPIPTDRVGAFLHRNRKLGELLPTLFLGSVLIALSGLVRRQVPRPSRTLSEAQG